MHVKLKTPAKRKREEYAQAGVIRMAGRSGRANLVVRWLDTRTTHLTPLGQTRADWYQGGPVARPAVIRNVEHSGELAFASSYRHAVLCKRALPLSAPPS